MTYRQLKANVKLRRTLMFSSIFMIVSGLMIFVFVMRNFAFTTSTLALGAVGYVLSMGGALAIFYSLNYTKKHTRCVKCRGQIDVADFLAMEDFKCPHCHFECSADEPIWSK